MIYKEMYLCINDKVSEFISGYNFTDVLDKFKSNIKCKLDGYIKIINTNTNESKTYTSNLKSTEI